MNTTRTAINANYKKVADAGAWTAIQNTGNEAIDVIISVALPSASSLGFIFRTLDTILPGTYGDGNVYIKTRDHNGASSVSISA